MVLSVLGISGLVWVILASLRIRRLDQEPNKYDPIELNNKLLTISKFHIVSIFCAFFGLIFLIIGFFFG